MIFDRVRGAGRLHELPKIICTAPQIILIEDSLTNPAEETGHAVLQDCAAYREHRSPGRKMITKRQQVVFVATRTVQQQQRRPRCAFIGRQENMRSIETGLLACHGMSMSSCSGGSAAAICSRLGSSQGGNLRLRPSSSNGSSTAKPGASVAISNSTPPGSRK